MTIASKVVVTGTGAVCGGRNVAGRDSRRRSSPGARRSRRSAQWDTTGWPCRVAAEIADFNPRALVDDRKLHKLIRRTDLVGLYAAGRAIERSGIVAHRDALERRRRGAATATAPASTSAPAAATTRTSTTTFRCSPRRAASCRPSAASSPNTVNPMWLLRTLPNNVLGHIGIKHGLKGANACITNHSVGGTLAVIEALRSAAQRRGRPRGRRRTRNADRAADGALLPPARACSRREMLRPFDARHDGSLFGEGAGALVLETEASAARASAGAG